jgi:hypothetical protein
MKFSRVGLSGWDTRRKLLLRKDGIKWYIRRPIDIRIRIHLKSSLLVLFD